jgi:parvulin-like peptidyl-prolyl isomerase
MLRTEISNAIYRSLLAANQGRPPSPAEVSRAVQNTSIDQRRQALDGLINQRLVLQAAERDRVTITDNELNQHFNQLRAQIAQNIGRQPTEEEFAQAIRNDTGQDMPAFRESIRRQAIVQKYLMTQKQDQITNIREPTEAEIVNFYNLARTQFVRPETVRVTVIHVPYGPDVASRARARELANRLDREINSNPARFDEAVLRAHLPNSGYDARDAGYLPRTLEAQQQVGMEFINTAFSLRQGQVSRVIEGNLGFQIIKITETYEQKTLELDEIAMLENRITVRQFIRAGMMEERQQQALARASQELISELRSAASIRITENNLNW